ncbi:hypothetical protein CDAR_240571 [Caerostris darwini]|uniref:Uncharacterized protein n=1 Tax=Caerostris darwini TaxID=1538125 RepID=A0AAV4PQ71_9ARAC|nr:hypothetical protein CDAR_240571 [Caerostris darwini]
MEDCTFNEGSPRPLFLNLLELVFRLVGVGCGGGRVDGFLVHYWNVCARWRRNAGVLIHRLIARRRIAGHEFRGGGFSKGLNEALLQEHLY